MLIVVSLQTNYGLYRFGMIMKYLEFLLRLKKPSRFPFQKAGPSRSALKLYGPSGALCRLDLYTLNPDSAIGVDKMAKMMT
jgi:hypothetical protein